MRNRALLLALCILAVALWGGLLFFMNHVPPSVTNQMAFLVIWGAAVSCTMIPVCYVANARLTAYSAAGEDRSLAVRRGLLAGMVAFILMALRFLRLLTLLSGVLLVLLVAILEASLTLRHR